jgi:hypothetical protein
MQLDDPGLSAKEKNDYFCGHTSVGCLCNNYYYCGGLWFNKLNDRVFDLWRGHDLLIASIN